MIALFGAAIFLSAFLLFLVQPMAAKMMLPLLGGAPAVWNTAMLFYQATLLAGYLYAHAGLRKISGRRHSKLHLWLLAAPAPFLPLALATAAPSGNENPVAWLLLAMAASVGVPFFVLSTTSPILQRWFSMTGHAAARDPYFLYAASNLGSMLALLAYPILVEPHVPLAAQAWLWSAGYVAFAVLVCGCALALWRAKSNDAADAGTPSVDDQPEGSLSKARLARWVALAFVPSSLMLGVTSFISTDIAVVPLLWVIPLALYLLSFILVFARRAWIPHHLTVRAFPVLLVGLAFMLAVPIQKPGALAVAAHLATFFGAAMLCHGELAKDRPAPGHLTAFYLWMSVGGALGGVFNALVAPVAFRTVAEYTIVLLLSGLFVPALKPGAGLRHRLGDLAAPALLGLCLMGGLALERKYGLGSSSQATLLFFAAASLGCLLAASRPLRFALALTALILVGFWQRPEPRRTLFAERSFFGVHRVVEDPGGGMRALLHGRIVHGTQLRNPEPSREPTTYYHRNGPVGQALSALGLPGRAKVGVVGLGTGGLAGYSRKGEEWTFFEIDPAVKRIACDPRLFTYVSGSPARIQVVLGDARLSLSRSAERFDALFLDAFTSDAVPAHLLTREAFELYRARLKPDGILLLHFTNRHLDLEPLIAAEASASGLRCLVQKDFAIPSEDRASGRDACAWAVFSRSRSRLSALGSDPRWKAPVSDSRVAAWTDDYSSILSVLRRL